MNKKLEEKIAVSFLEFARNHKKDCKLNVLIRDSSQIMHLIVHDEEKEDLENTEIFGHSIIVEGDEITDQGTIFVRDGREHRKLYREFLGHMEIYGFKLRNSFEERWKENPIRYPV